MSKDLIPTDEEFDTILLALENYRAKAKELASNEEVIRATGRISKKSAKDNASAFEEAFSSDSSIKGVDNFLSDLVKEIDLKAIAKASSEASNQLTLISAKVIKLREHCRSSMTDQAIKSLLAS